MNPTFDTLVEQVKVRSTEEKEELKFLLERTLIEERRAEMRANYEHSRAEQNRGKVKFSSSLRELKKQLAPS